MQVSHDNLERLLRREGRTGRSFHVPGIIKHKCLIEARFTLLRFHLDPFLLLKTELFFLPVHITPFLNKNGYLSSVVSSKTDLITFCLSLLSVLCFFCFRIMFRPLFVISVSKFLRFWVFTLQLCVSI